MKYPITYFSFSIFRKFRQYYCKLFNKKQFDGFKTYGKRQMLSCNDVHQYIHDMILSGKPFCVARFGLIELMCASSNEFNYQKKMEFSMKLLHSNAGFFPKDVRLGEDFNQVIKKSCSQVDVFAVWDLRFEDYYISKYTSPNTKTTFLYNIEPWKNLQNPWSSALKGKKVLFVHPFEDTILNQSTKKDFIFPNSDVLPDFELLTLKAVQTIAGNTDDRFHTWFEALDWMYEEAIKKDFDIAIIGCGAYGIALAAKLKEAGKQAIHLGGATQLFWGIKGRRWDEEPDKEYVRKLYNENWCYPLKTDTPNNSNIVEGSCYWAPSESNSQDTNNN